MNAIPVNIINVIKVTIHLIKRFNYTASITDSIAAKKAANQ